MMFGSTPYGAVPYASTLDSNPGTSFSGKLPMLLAAGVSAVLVAVGASPALPAFQASATVTVIDKARASLARLPALAVASTVHVLVTARGAGRLGALSAAGSIRTGRARPFVRGWTECPRPSSTWDECTPVGSLREGES